MFELFIAVALLLGASAGGVENERAKWCKFTYERHTDVSRCLDTPDWDEDNLITILRAN